MSVIAVDNARPSAGGTAYSLTDGVAKAWVNFNGTGTIATRDSLNVSSLTDNGTGDYTVNYTSAFSAADYSAQPASIGDIPSSAAAADAAGQSYTTSNIRTRTYDTVGASFRDATACTATVHGDLA